ncbi:hypothetical protein M9458_037086, partial [Cirrhinus mrigala]
TELEGSSGVWRVPPAHPEPSQPTPQLTEPEPKPKPTADREPELRTTEPSPMGVQEPATMPATVDVPVGTAHFTAEGERRLDLGHFNVEQDLIDFSEDIYVELPAYPSPSRAPPPPAPPSPSSTVGYYHGCGLGLAWLLLLR